MKLKKNWRIKRKKQMRKNNRKKIKKRKVER
jgi:hypothetical protein